MLSFYGIYSMILMPCFAWSKRTIGMIKIVCAGLNCNNLTDIISNNTDTGGVQFTPGMLHIVLHSFVS